MGLAVCAGGTLHLASDASAYPAHSVATTTLSPSTASQTAFPASTNEAAVRSSLISAKTTTFSATPLSPTALATAVSATALAAAVSTVRHHRCERSRVLQWVCASPRQREPVLRVSRRHEGREAILPGHDRD